MKRLVLAMCAAAAAWAGLPSQQEALSMAFPGAKLQRKEHFLTEAQAQRVKDLSGGELGGLWFVAYEATKEGKPAGVAFFDTHRVRTLNETAMVAVSPDGKVARVEVVIFREPQDYLPKENWIRQFDGKALGPDFSLRRAIRPLSGATLTAQALTDSGRRCLGLWQVLYRDNK